MSAVANTVRAPSNPASRRPPSAVRGRGVRPSRRATINRSILASSVAETNFPRSRLAHRPDDPPPPLSGRLPRASEIRSACRLPGAPSNGTSVKTSASWNPFAQNSDKAGIVGSQGRDDYEAEDVEYYFNYMGILADEGSNDRMDALVEAGKHPIDIILLFAAAEGDTPKIEEILEAGADASVTDLDGNTPMMLAGKNNPEKKAAVEALLAGK
eukprot:30706-Pelagococcus_subviridis.AAC.5